MTLIVSSLQIHKPTLDETEIINAIDKYGVNLRTLRQILIQQKESAVIEQITEKVKALSLTDVRSMLSTEFETTEQTSHSIIMTLCPEQPQSDADENYLQGDIGKRTLSCDLVFKLLLQKHGTAFYKDAQYFARLFATVPQTSASAGHLWEQQCHLVIPSLPHIDLIPMKVYKNKLVPTTAKKGEQVMIAKPIPEVHTKRATLKYTANPKCYWIPLSSNNATFDAFFRCGPKGIGLQMTLGTHHSLIPSGLEELRDRLWATKAEDLYFVFVIPKGQVFSCPKPDDDWLSVFTFYILEMEFSKYCWFSLDF